MFRLCFFLLTVCVCDTVCAQRTYPVMAIREAITIDGKWDKPVLEKSQADKHGELPASMITKPSNQPHEQKRFN